MPPHTCRLSNSGADVANETATADHSLTPDQRRITEAWVKEHWAGSKACPICTQSKWSIAEHVVQPVTHSPIGALNLGGGPAYPAVPMICNTCGYTVYFNAVIMGLFAPAKEAENAKG